MKSSHLNSILSLVIVLLFVRTTFESRSKSKLYLSNKLRLYHTNLNQKVTQPTPGKDASAAKNATGNGTQADLELHERKSGNQTVESYLTNVGNENLHGIFINKNNTQCEIHKKILQCRDTICSTCTYIPDLYNYFIQKPCYINMNMYTVNLYEMKDPSTMIVSQDLVHANLPTNIGGAPNCFTMNADKENKTMTVCLPDPMRNENFNDAAFAYARCRQGLSPQGGLPSLMDCQKLFGDGVIAQKGSKQAFKNQKEGQGINQDTAALVGGAAAARMGA